MIRFPVLLPLTFCLLGAQAPAWKEFSIGPATGRVAGNSNNPHLGFLRVNAISLKSLIAVAAGMRAAFVLGPDWMDSERYRVAAMLADASRHRLVTGDSVADDFRSLLMQEMVARFHLEFHREKRAGLAYTLRIAPGNAWKARKSAPRERGQIVRTGTPVTNLNTTVEARGATLQEFCDWLQRYLKAPVALALPAPDGSWDFKVTWQTADPATLSPALKERVGLELVEESGEREYLVVDKVERPEPAVPKL